MDELRVLLVDDNDTDLELMKFQLNHVVKGLNIRTANSCGAVLKRLDLDSFGCFVIDFNLTDGDGVELCEEIRRRMIKSPIIIITGGVHPDHMDRMAKSDINAVVFKKEYEYLPKMVIDLIKMFSENKRMALRVSSQLKEVSERVDSLMKEVSSNWTTCEK